MDWWEAFDSARPIGSFRLYEILSLIGSTMWAVKGKEMPPETFTPWAKEPARELTGDESLAAVRMGVMAMATRM